MLLKFKQNLLVLNRNGSPGPAENEKQMLTTKSCLLWKTGSCKTLRRNNAASLWSLHDFVSIDLWIDNNCRTQRPGLTGPHPENFPSSGPLCSEWRESWSLVVCSAVPQLAAWISPSLHVACQKFCFAVAVVVYRRMGLGRFQLENSVSHPALFSQTLNELKLI